MENSLLTSAQLILPPPPRAPDLSFSAEDKKLYWDRSHYDSPEAQMKALTTSSTLYVGNVAFSTRTAHIRSHFSQLGPVKQIHMGLDRNKKMPCGFCFVEYYSREDALAAVSLLSSTKLDGQVIRVELDSGFIPGRQFGRGVKGGQVRHDRKAEEARKRERNDYNMPEKPRESTETGAENFNGSREDDDDMEPSNKRMRM
ncbi:nuclear cap-binding protein subunit 2 [Fistulifera solaris]|jgi:nuclear cap-binding protein subunit 2|uniref:Nuclear cap-binding protein subunit 2 n=1 Tax=Fistulifera solaris TaxID=1519565 RepID=A0A1Z5KNW6_FISSO|nr:nuclear cap-binding protein subunit 2 [Fistulifera solaris]|eukprot:GAX27782.1 nuclear cap-binding protein subunit 2 [Fistulifera solaris]